MAQCLILIGCAILMVTVISGILFLPETDNCLARQTSHALITACNKTLTEDPGHRRTPIQFYDDNNSSSYCRDNKAGYIEYAICYKSVLQRCYKDSGMGDLAVSDSDFKAAINYFCDRVNNGFFEVSSRCKLNILTLTSCNKQTYYDLNLPTSLSTYEDKKLFVCGRDATNYVCYRDNYSLKTTCPEEVITYTTALEKAIPSACRGIFPKDIFPLTTPPNGCDRMMFNYITMIIVAFSVLLL